MLNSSAFTWALIGVSACFAAYMLYTRQVKWVAGVLKSALLGVIGMLAANFALAPLGVAVGVNALTVFIVGILGLPGFLLLYVSRFIVG